MVGLVTTQLSLDHIGLLEGTDKTSLANDYLRHYERILLDLRNKPFQLLEIGVAAGASLRTWEKFLPQATIVGVDINDASLAYAGGRVAIEIGSQADPLFLSALAAKYQPSVIIDDGSHQSAHVFITLQHLFPCLVPGGVYIVEDLQLHHGANTQKFHGQGGTTPTEYLAGIARRLASDHVDPECTEADRHFVASIDRIEFMPRAIAIYKRAIDHTRENLDDLFERATLADHALTWFHLSWVLIQHDDLARAELAVRRALLQVPNHPAYWPRLADILTRQGKLTQAVDALREAIRLNPDVAVLKTMMTRLENQLMDQPESLSASA
jgi:tetratricopeptide (TPR) repeat protein